MPSVGPATFLPRKMRRGSVTTLAQAILMAMDGWTSHSQQKAVRQTSRAWANGSRGGRPARIQPKPFKKHKLPGKHPGATNIMPVDVNGDGKLDIVASRGHGVGLDLVSRIPSGPSTRSTMTCNRRIACKLVTSIMTAISMPPPAPISAARPRGLKTMAKENSPRTLSMPISAPTTSA